MPKDTRKAFLAALSKVSPNLETAFLVSVQDIRSTAQAAAIDAAIKRAVESGNLARGLQEVTAAIQLGPEFWAPLDQAIQDAFTSGGVYQMSMLPKRTSTGSVGPLIVRFQGRHPRAEAWSRQRAGDLITELADDQRALIHDTLADAVETGRPYSKVTQDLIGRLDGNERKGGLIGLHSQQADAVRRMRAALTGPDVGEADGKRVFWVKRDGSLGSAFTKRDKRFDTTILRALRDGGSIPAAKVDDMSRRYSDSLLLVRGKRISRTEGNKAMNAGRAEATAQMIERGEIPADAVTKIWDSTPGPRTRDSHRALNGQSVQWGEKFQSPVTRILLDWPHDEDAPARETVNCRCSARFRTDWKRVARWRRDGF